MIRGTICGGKPREKSFDFGNILERDENRHSFIAITGNHHLAKALCEILAGHKFREFGRRQNAIVANLVRAEDAALYADFCWACLKCMSSCASLGLGTKAFKNGHAAKGNDDRMYRHWAPRALILPVGPISLRHFDYFWGLLQIARRWKLRAALKEFPRTHLPFCQNTVELGSWREACRRHPKDLGFALGVRR